MVWFVLRHCATLGRRTARSTPPFRAERCARPRRVQKASFCATVQCRTKRSAAPLGAETCVLRDLWVQNAPFCAALTRRTTRSAPRLKTGRFGLRGRWVQNGNNFNPPLVCSTLHAALQSSAEQSVLRFYATLAPRTVRSSRPFRAKLFVLRRRRA